MNGDYLVIGVEVQDGIPVLPPKGIEKTMLIKSNKKFSNTVIYLSRDIPMIEVINYPGDDTILIYLKCSAGDAEPYRAPKAVYAKNREAERIRQCTFGYARRH